MFCDHDFLFRIVAVISEYIINCIFIVKNQLIYGTLYFILGFVNFGDCLPFMIFGGLKLIRIAVRWVFLDLSLRFIFLFGWFWKNILIFLDGFTFSANVFLYLFLLVILLELLLFNLNCIFITLMCFFIWLCLSLFFMVLGVTDL